MKRLLLILSVTAGLMITGCGSDDSGHSHGERADHTHETEQHKTGEDHAAHTDDGSEKTDTTHTHAENEEEHSHSGEDAHSREGEASGTTLELNETYDQVRKGVHLTLSYNSDTGTFSGTVENTTQAALQQISVRVKLSNGTKLGPTASVTLDAGESQPVKLDAAGETFDGWSAHSKMGNSEHSHGEDGDHQH